jgi:hypothetical protein
MRKTKKLNPLQRLEHINAAGELQWDINQGKIVEAGANPLLDRDRKIYLAGWGQGAGWAHKAIADEMLRLSSPWKPSEKYASVKPFPAQADRGREFPDGSVETCYQVLLSFLEMIEEAMVMPEMEKPDVAANKAICRFLRDDFKRALNAIESTEQMLGNEGGENAG